MDITATDRARLSHTVDRLNAAQVYIHAMLDEYKFPYKYEELLDLMDRQKLAITNVLEGRELGCEMDSLVLNVEAMITPAHLQNLQALVLKNAHLEGPAKNVAIMPEAEILHEIKDKRLITTVAVTQLRQVLQGMARHIATGANHHVR